MTIIDGLLRDLPFTRQELMRIALFAPKRYKTYLVPKKSPGEFREISQPSAELKILQKWIVEKAINEMPVSIAATAYVTGKSILDNAMPHAKSKFILKMDFRNFFPSITQGDLKRHIGEHTNLSELEIEFVSRCLCKHYKGKGHALSIGAPSSPFVSNSVLYNFDCLTINACEKCNVVYTRYADDLTFSSNDPDSLVFMEKYVKKSVTEIEYPRLAINAAKTIFVSKKYSRRVTGLTITNDGSVSIGREQKRKIRAALNRLGKGQLSKNEQEWLFGYLAYVRSVEPEFYQRILSWHPRLG